MFNFPMKCPHCLNTERFQIDSFTNYTGMAPIPTVYVQPGKGPPPVPLNPIKVYGVALCPRPNCGGPVLIWFRVDHPMILTGGTSGMPAFRFSGPPPEVIGTWPSAPAPDDSEHWPVNLREVFREVQEDARAQRNPARIVAACRSVLEVALAEIGYPKKIGSLQTRINSAQIDGKITIGMADWAKKIKIDGNEAIHELNANRADADDLVNYIRTFLDVAFDLPHRIKALEPSET